MLRTIWPVRIGRAPIRTKPLSGRRRFSASEAVLSPPITLPPNSSRHANLQPIWLLSPAFSDPRSGCHGARRPFRSSKGSITCFRNASRCVKASYHRATLGRRASVTSRFA